MKLTLFLTPICVLWANSAAAHGGKIMHGDGSLHLHAEQIVMTAVAAGVTLFVARKLLKVLAKTRK